MPERPDFPKMEEEVLEFWRKEDIFRKTLEKPAPQGNFVFFEGPPTANGLPGIHHVESRAYKDLIPRYKTMRGFRVDRKAGWDTHGLPVEIEVEKKLGISGKQQIETIKATPRESIAHFNELCKKSVWTYLEDWVKLTERIGFWVDLEHPYVTYYNEYMESLWWIVKQIHERGLLYKDYKVVPYCPRCGTSLSSHELAQGYKEIEDPAVYVKFQIKPPTPNPQPPTFFLAWTTTPWTLPGNLALAVGADVDYVMIEQRTDNRELRTERLILAKARLGVIDGEYQIVEEYKGKDFVGWEYEPLYTFVEYDRKAHYVALADFVSTEDGTGIVHTAVMYGAEDFELGQKLGLPKQHLVDLEGKFVDAVKPWAHVFVHEANPGIIRDLESRGLLYKQETYTHSYPFCWRCKTKLVYYAKDSWFVKMSALRDDLVRANGTINWVPDHIKEGRFGEWLREVKDWAFSRERYWGTPLPIWICEKDTTHRKVVGSFAEFPESPSGNTYHILRHGRANHNDANIVTNRADAPYHITDEGRAQVVEAARRLRREGGIDVIVSSPAIRSRETAEIVGQEFGVAIEYDDRLLDINFGIYEGKSIPEWEARFARTIEKFDHTIAGADTWIDVLRRVHATLRDIDAKYRGQRILIVGHGDPLMLLEASLAGHSRKGIANWNDTNYIKIGELRKLSYRTLPFAADGLVDPHRPYVDDVTFACECGGTMRRTPEVVDVWFDSGAMPFAQWHYPFENKEQVEVGGLFPADYISEAIDQTRGWFYTLLAVSVLLDRGAPYKNVICLGHIVDAEGKKMSKSIGNVVDPWEVVNRFGADAVRFFMYTTTQPGDTKRFDSKDLDLIVKQTFMILWNVLAFWKLYVSGVSSFKFHVSRPKHVMDQWILARLGEVTKHMTERLDAYDVTPAARAITEFVNDLSTWYVRRSRDRFKSGGEEPVVVLHHVLATLAKLMAPFTPFIADSIYRELTTNYGLHTTYSSVHLADWPTADAIDQKLLDEMDGARKFAELAHALRQEAGLKVRQPLAVLEHSGAEFHPEIRAILQDEVNVDVVRAGITSPGDGMVRKEAGAAVVALDTRMTPELRSRGMLRDITRHINDLRKTQGLTIRDRIAIFYETKDNGVREVMEKYADGLKAATLANSVQAGKTGAGTDLEIGEAKVWLGIQKL